MIVPFGFKCESMPPRLALPRIQPSLAGLTGLGLHTRHSASLHAGLFSGAPDGALDEGATGKLCQRPPLITRSEH